MPVYFMPHMHMVVWKLQNGAKSLFKLGAGQKLTCLDPLRKGCRDFFDNYWSGTPYLQLSLLSTAGYLLPTLTPDVELLMYLPRHMALFNLSFNPGTQSPHCRSTTHAPTPSFAWTSPSVSHLLALSSIPPLIMFLKF
jgi:hypothetical protein